MILAFESREMSKIFREEHAKISAVTPAIRQMVEFLTGRILQ